MDYGADPTLITTGMLPSLILAAAALTAPVSVFLLWRYRRAVMRSMAAYAGAAPTPAPAPAASPPAHATAALSVQAVDAGAFDNVWPSAYRDALRSLYAATAVYAAAGLSYAIVLASAWLVFTHDEDVVLTRLLWLLSCYARPTALAVGMIVAVSRGQRIAVAAAYFAMLFAVALYGTVRNAELTFGQLAAFWLFTNAPATILLLAFLHRRVRAVGPLVLAFMVTAVIGSQVLLGIAASSEAGLRSAVSVGAVLGLGGAQVFVAIMLLGFVLFGVAGWWFLKWLGRRYQQRRMSDQSLTLDAMWLMFGVVQSITLAFEGWAWVLTGPAAFVVYKVVAKLGFALSAAARPVGRCPTLLLLRVFSLGSRSERLFDALSKRWLRAGPISLIAGPDLVASTIEPHEFLEFMGGSLSRQFVRSGGDLERRLGAMDRGPDPDGRYRVNEFFCYADTWQQTMRALAAGADAVLMDLRSFSPANQGCIFELEQLLAGVPLERVVFLLDATTDRAFLESTLNDAWRRLRPDSPNRGLSMPQARLVSVGEHSARAISGVLKLLFTQPAAAR